MITLVRPCRGQVTQWYGNTQPDGNPHTGNDYAYTDGDLIFPEVFAAAAGTVVYAGDSRALGWPNPWYFNPDFDRTDDWDSSAGNVLVIAHPGYVTTYSHLEAWTVAKGQVVSAGQRIGTIGNTGNSYGKHLHFELIPYPFDFGTATYGRTNPNPYMTGGGLAAQGSIEQDAFLMALSDDDQAQIKRAADRIMGVIDRPHDRVLTVADLPLIADAVLDDQTPLPGGGSTSARTKDRYQKQEFEVSQNLIKELSGKVDTLAGIVAELVRKDAS